MYTFFIKSHVVHLYMCYVYPFLVYSQQYQMHIKYQDKDVCQQPRKTYVRHTVCYLLVTNFNSLCL